MDTAGSKLSNPIRAYTFDELLLLPGYARTSPKDINTAFTLNGVELKIPILSAAMDTVTESEMATALALSGGMGVIHRNCSIDDAVGMIRKVKKAAIPSGNGVATKDSGGRLAVGAAVSLEVERAIALSKEADILFTDVASFHNKKVIDATKKIIEETGKKIVIGNMGTKEGTLHALKELGPENIAAVKVGMGGGSICTTTDITGVGSPVPFAIEGAAKALSEMKMLGKIPIIADGGIKYSRDIAFSLGLGASLVMLGNLLARCDESPGEKIKKDGKFYKVYWGMGSAEARKRREATDRYQDAGKGKSVDEGITMHVPLEGSVNEVVDRLVSQVKTTMGYVGAGNIKEMNEIAEFAIIRPREEKKGEK